MSYIEFIRRTISGVLIVAIMLFGIIALWTLRSFLLIGFTAWVISVALSVPVGYLQRQGVGRGPAILASILGVLLLIFLGINSIFPPIFEQFGALIDDLPSAVEDSVASYEDFYNNNDDLQTFLPEFTVDDYEELVNPRTDELPQSRSMSQLDFGGIFSSAIPILSGVGSLVGDVLTNFLLIFFLTLYFVLDPMMYYRGILALVPEHLEERTVELLNEIRRIVLAWFSALSVSITAQATMVFIILTLLGVPNASALALIAGISNIIPNLGFYAALVPVILFTVADDPAKLPIVVVLYVIAGEIEGKVITPRVVQSELNLPAGLVLLFQLIAAAYLGFFGILLAVPLLAIIVALVREIYVVDSLGKTEQGNELAEDEHGHLYLKPRHETSEPDPDPA